MVRPAPNSKGAIPGKFTSHLIDKQSGLWDLPAIDLDTLSLIWALLLFFRCSWYNHDINRRDGRVKMAMDRKSIKGEIDPKHSDSNMDTELRYAK